MVPDSRFGRALMLRDGEGVTSDVAVVPAPLIPVVVRLDGRHTARDIARELAPPGEVDTLAAQIEQVVQELDQALFLDNARYRTERARLEGEFARSATRPASHAGSAYHAEASELKKFLEIECFGAEPNGVESPRRGLPGELVGLIAPHIDPWRGKVNYGHAYRMLRDAPPPPDTFVLLGTSHAPMREPFALCRKSFDTPLGPVQADLGAIDVLARASTFDPYADLYNHKREHSLELQAVFVKYLAGDRNVRIIPILCGLGAARGDHPEGDARIEPFLRALRGVCERGGRGGTLVIAGADLAHVGPRFGDDAPYDAAQRLLLEKTDRASLALAAQGDHRGFFAHVANDLETRRVCGLAPIYTLLRLMPAGASGRIARYEQTVDPEEGSIVSHAAVGFYAGAAHRS